MCLIAPHGSSSGWIGALQRWGASSGLQERPLTGCGAWPFLLTLAEQASTQGRCLIGLSALPGCGKTTLGVWLEEAAKTLGLSFQVVSIDDFTWPVQSSSIDGGEPRGVPRAIPGSHELELMATTLAAWKAGESVQLPCFDKALRHGRGDRSGWLLRCLGAALEGWFVGCEPLDENDEIHRGSEHLDPPLQDGEFEYRPMVQPP